MNSINDTLVGVKRLSGWLETRATIAWTNRQKRVFAAYRLTDGRSWRGGYYGPPWGSYRNARLNWWRDLLKMVRDEQSEGVVLKPEQVRWLLHIAESASGQTQRGDDKVWR